MSVSGSKQRELIAADAEGGVGSTKRFLQRGRSGAQNFIAARMAVLVVDFFETMEIEDDQAELRAVPAAAIELFVKDFAEQAAIVKAGQRIGDRIELECLQFVVFKDDGNAEQSRGREDIHQSGLQPNRAAEVFAQLPAAGEHFVPKLDALIFAQIQMRNRAHVALQKLTAR